VCSCDTCASVIDLLAFVCCLCVGLWCVRWAEVLWCWGCVECAGCWGGAGVGWGGGGGGGGNLYCT